MTTSPRCSRRSRRAADRPAGSPRDVPVAAAPAEEWSCPWTRISQTLDDEAAPGRRRRRTFASAGASAPCGSSAICRWPTSPSRPASRSARSARSSAACRRCGCGCSGRSPPRSMSSRQALIVDDDDEASDLYCVRAPTAADAAGLLRRHPQGAAVAAGRRADRPARAGRAGRRHGRSLRPCRPRVRDVVAGRGRTDGRRRRISAEGGRQLRLQEHARARLPQPGQPSAARSSGSTPPSRPRCAMARDPLLRLDACQQALSRRHRRPRRCRSRHRAGRVPQPARALRLRQDDEPARHRRLREADRGARSARRPRHHCAQALSTGRSTPSSRTMPCSRTWTSPRMSASACRCAGYRRATSPARCAGALDLVGLADKIDARVSALVGWPAPARRARPRHRLRAARAAARRAAVGARRPSARADAGRVEAACRRGSAPPSSWSPTTRPRRCRSPTASWS